MKLLTEQQFIILANAKHSNRYDYSSIQFPVKMSEVIELDDPEYGSFTVPVNRHLTGKGHVKYGQKRSADAKRMGQETFIDRAKIIHNDLYDYSKVLYEQMNKKVCIIDPVYGEFWQTPAGHLGQKQGHPSRGKLKAANARRQPLDEFISRAKEKHGDLYDYSKVIYTSIDDKVCIIDPEYGEFWQSPYQHLNSHGCPARTAEKKWLIHIDHIIPLSIVHSNRKQYTQWNKLRPLYNFLNSNINLHKVTAKFNRDKSDYITINNKIIAACSVRNNYDVIAYLIKTLLGVDPTDIIEQDKQYVRKYLGIADK